MKDKHNKFYVTTPIYYVTAKPHLGSLYSTILADVAARWHRLCGKKVFFLTGTDEHGQKIADAAAKAGKKTKEFIDNFIPAYQDMWHKYHIDYTYFIRTTDEQHIKAVQHWIKQLMAKGDIYKSFYSGFYCTPCETFVTEKDTHDKDDTPLCPSCSRITAYVSEESYFFQLSAYQNKLLDFYAEHPDFITPAERLNEVVSFVKSGLKDLSISRTTVEWGIPFPGDAKHITYVWADALNNYITAVGYGDSQREQELSYWWPADLQVMGKDIVRFHAVYWPAFLMASGLSLPKQLLVHGWIKVNDQKMSKSLGNVIDPQMLLDTYGADEVRYYLIRHIAITQDAEFSIVDLEQRISADLANDLGNLLQRMIALAHKRELYHIEGPINWASRELELRDTFWNTLETVKQDMEEGYFYRALASLWKFISHVNSYFHTQEPWKIQDKTRFEQVISATAHSLYAIGILAWPIMPKKMDELLMSLTVTIELEIDTIQLLSENPWNKTFTLNKISTLFTKYTKQEDLTIKKETMLKDSEQQAMEKQETVKLGNNITIDDVSKIMLLVGTIEQCQEVPKSDKLFKLLINFGSYGVRQILSGVRKHFSAQDLLNKQSIFVYNLAPRIMMGLESQGMMLFASDEHNKFTLLTPERPVPDGTRLQ